MLIAFSNHDLIYYFFYLIISNPYCILSLCVNTFQNLSITHYTKIDKVFRKQIFRVRKAREIFTRCCLGDIPSLTVEQILEIRTVEYRNKGEPNIYDELNAVMG